MVSDRAFILLNCVFLGLRPFLGPRVRLSVKVKCQGHVSFFFFKGFLWGNWSFTNAACFLQILMLNLFAAVVVVVI